MTIRQSVQVVSRVNNRRCLNPAEEIRQRNRGRMKLLGFVLLSSGLGKTLVLTISKYRYLNDCTKEFTKRSGAKATNFDWV